jgi:mannose-6-phosphate isomerase-like protein (cupin superfamily)
LSAPTIAEPLAGRVMGSPENAFVIAEWRDAGAPAGPPRYIAPLHVHHRDDEAWYVLEGALRVQRGDEIIEAKAGSAVFVPRGIKHTYWNPSPEPTRYLLVMTANIYAMIQGIHAMKERTPAALRLLFAKHDSEVLDS